MQILLLVFDACSNHADFVLIMFHLFTISNFLQTNLTPDQNYDF